MKGAGTISLLVNKCNFVAVAVMFSDGSYIFFFFFLVTLPLLLVYLRCGALRNVKNKLCLPRFFMLFGHVKASRALMLFCAA